MKKIFLGIGIAIVFFFFYQFFSADKERDQVHYNTKLIQKELKNVGKLIVTEGAFSQAFTYKDSKKFYFDIFSSEKKAIVIVNTKVTIAYDLKKITTQIIPENKEVIITNIPEAEISIHPDIEYYDVQQDYFNTFTAEDLNKIKKRINRVITEEIENSNLKKNAKDRLLSELQKIYILTHSMGWTLKYNQTPIHSKEDLNTISL